MLRRTALALATVLTGALLGSVLLAAPAGAVGSRMQITFIQYNPPGADTSANLNNEFVTVTNTSGDTISLNGWHLYDQDGHGYAFGNFTVGPHTKVRIHTGPGTNTPSNRYWGERNYVWNNTGDRARLRDPLNRLVDQCTYKPTSAGYLYC